jgi:Flp pilus assembly pilin Flp
MRLLLKKAAGFFRRPKGQTMAEYALLLASVAIIVYAGYQRMGTTITTVLSSVDTKL